MAFQITKPLASSKEVIDNLSTGFKVIAALIAVVSSIVGAVLTVDARYTHQDDFLEFQKNHDESEAKQHKTYLENRVKELNMKRAINGKLDKYDQVVLSNSLQQIKDDK